MALMKPLDFLRAGVDATYWRIASLYADRIAGSLTIQLHGYVSEEARQEGYVPLAVTSITVPFTGNEMTMTAAYGVVRAHVAGHDAEGDPIRPFFDAQDV